MVSKPLRFYRLLRETAEAAEEGIFHSRLSDSESYERYKKLREVNAIKIRFIAKVAKGENEVLANILHKTPSKRKIRTSLRFTCHEILHRLLSQKVGNHGGIFHWQGGGGGGSIRYAVPS